MLANVHTRTRIYHLDKRNPWDLLMFLWATDRLGNTGNGKTSYSDSVKWKTDDPLKTEVPLCTDCFWTDYPLSFTTTTAFISRGRRESYPKESLRNATNDSAELWSESAELLTRPFTTNYIPGGSLKIPWFLCPCLPTCRPSARPSSAPAPEC